MAHKYYQFDYAEMSGFEIKSLGIINLQSARDISRENLKDVARKYLQVPDANIVISNVAKLTKTEFEEMKESQVTY